MTLVENAAILMDAASVSTEARLGGWKEVPRVPEDFFRQTGSEASTPAISASCEHFGGVVVVHLNGDLDMETVGQAEQTVNDAVDHTTTVLILDLNGITFFASRGLHLLVRLKETTHDHGRGLCIVAANRQVLRPLKITELDVAFEIHPTVEHALAAVLQPPAS
jgi:anti-anti-sigma factor